MLVAVPAAAIVVPETTLSPAFSPWRLVSHVDRT